MFILFSVSYISKKIDKHAIKIPVNCKVDIFSLKKIIPVMAEQITMDTLLIGKTIELCQPLFDKAFIK